MLNRLSRLRVSAPSRALNYRTFAIRSNFQNIRDYGSVQDFEDPAQFFKSKIDKKTETGVGLAQSVTKKMAENKYERD